MPAHTTAATHWPGSAHTRTSDEREPTLWLSVKRAIALWISHRTRQSALSAERSWGTIPSCKHASLHLPRQHPTHPSRGHAHSHAPLPAPACGRPQDRGALIRLPLAGGPAVTAPGAAGAELLGRTLSRSRRPGASLLPTHPSCTPCSNPNSHANVSARRGVGYRVGRRSSVGGTSRTTRTSDARRNWPRGWPWCPCGPFRRFAAVRSAVTGRRTCGTTASRH